MSETTPQRTNILLILALWGAGLGAAAQYAKLAVVFDRLPQIYPEAGTMLGWAVSLVGFVGIVFGVVAGLLVARIRYRRALLLSLWLGAIVSALQAFGPPFWLFLLLRGIEGVSHLGMVVAAPTLIAQLCAPQDRGWALTLWGTFFGVAFAVLTWGGLPLVDAYGVFALMGAHSIYMVAFAVILSVGLKGLPGQGPDIPLSLRGMLRGHLGIYRSPHVSAAGLGWLFYTFCFVSILTVMPPFLADNIRGFIMGAMPLLSIVVSLTLGVWLLRYRTAVWVVCLGFALSAAALAWLWVIPGGALACLALAGAMGLIQGATFAAVPQLNTTAATQAQANGAMAQMGNLGNTLGTPVMAAALGLMGYAALPVLAGGAMILGLAIHFHLGKLRNNI